MTTTRRFVRPGIEQITRDKWGRWYDWKGERYWSVTTIIKRGTSNHVLAEWGKKYTANFAIDNLRKLNALMEPDGTGEVDRASAYEFVRNSTERYTDRRANIGTTLHDYAEAYATGKPMPEAIGEIADMLGHFGRWLETFRPVFLMAEAPVFSRAEKYAGSLDAIAEFDRALIPDVALALMTGQDTADLAFRQWNGVAGPDVVRLLIDYKTGKGVYDGTALQLAAYRHADFVGLPDGSEQFMPEVDGAAVLHVRADRYGFVPVDTGPDVYKSFLYAREVYRWHRDISRGVIGDPMEVAHANS